MWYWYIRKPHEIFLDLDSKKAVMRAMAVLRWSKCKRVKNVWLFPSQSHAHMIVEMNQPIDDGPAALWALWAGSDRMRAVHVIDRIMTSVDFPDILISRKSYFRNANIRCQCAGKHDRKTGRVCPVMNALRPGYIESDFPLRGKKSGWSGPVQFKWGKISKKLIMSR